MIVTLLAVTVILLLPGGAPFLIRLCSAAAILIGLGAAFALWGPLAAWVVGGLAAFIAGAFVYAFVVELKKPRKRFLSGGP
jgi:hypothetical protein